MKCPYCQTDTAGNHQEGCPNIAQASSCTSEGVGSPLQFFYTVPYPCPRDIQAMSVWSQEMNRVAETVTPRELRAAFEWFKSWGESKIKELEANAGNQGQLPRKGTNE